MHVQIQPSHLKHVPFILILPRNTITQYFLLNILSNLLKLQALTSMTSFHGHKNLNSPIIANFMESSHTFIHVCTFNLLAIGKIIGSVKIWEQLGNSLYP
jgi:hypothetical protein